MTLLRVTSPSPPRTAALSRACPAWPTIVAESLEGIAEPLATVLAGGPPAPASHVVAALAASLAPPEAAADAPEWLWPMQRLAFRRALAALERYGGALCADPVGTGKTYVALAAARWINGRRSTICLVPAGLRHQWQQAAARTGVPVTAWSHERASRGSLPPQAGRLVIIDECHRFRNPATQGYARVAPWLLGRCTLLVSATPVVNRLADLAHQLRLAVRDDALAPQGVPSLGALLQAGRGHPALGLLVLSSAAATPARPRAAERTEQVGTAGERLEGVLGDVDRLALSTHPSVAALLRAMLWRSAASSPAALEAALRRYRRLLQHARDAADAGRRPTRHSVRQLTQGLGDQLLMWELLPSMDEPVELVPDDLPLLDSLITRAAASAANDDTKLYRLRRLLADGRRTLVFTVSRETVRWLRHRLGHRVAWCTGDRAGIGPLRAPRRAVLDWFRAESPADRLPEPWAAPVHLVCTDVAAEGLDLQAAERVVHYDLPWTPMRMEQRRGRIVRGGSRHRHVEIVRFAPPPELERRLQQAELLVRKARLPAKVGLGEERSLWQWRAELAAQFSAVSQQRGIAAIAGEPGGVLAGFTLHCWPGNETPPLAAYVLWWDERSGWTELPQTLERRLRDALAGPPVAAPAQLFRRSLHQVGAAARERLRAIRRAAWEAPAPAPGARALLARLDPLARSAARRRDPASLALVQRAIAFAARGHTAGESREIERLARLTDAELRSALGGVPPTAPGPSAVVARVTGVILFLSPATFPQCRSARSCSISTAP
jgi:superfamily II DNA or RNA helicase